MKSNQKKSYQLDSDIFERGIKYGLITAMSMLAYFFIMNFAGLTTSTELRFFNFVILGGGIFLAIRSLYIVEEEGHSNYFSGILTGISTASIAGSTFGITLLIYWLLIEPKSALAIIEVVKIGSINPAELAGIAMLENIMSGYTLSFIVMQYFKNHPAAIDKHTYQS